MELLLFALVGALAGGLASVTMRVRSFAGILMDVILGLFGAITGGIILELLGQQPLSGLVDPYSMLLAATGAALWIIVGNTLDLV